MRFRLTRLGVGVDAATTSFLGQAAAASVNGEVISAGQNIEAAFASAASIMSSVARASK